MKSDNEPALTSLIESRSTLRALKSGSRTIIENSLGGSSSSNGIVERAIQSVQGMIRTIRRAIDVGGEDFCDALRGALDRRTSGVLVDKARSRSRRQKGA